MTPPTARHRGPTIRGLALVSLWVLPLAIWPGLDRPFSTPKLVVVLAATGTLALFAAVNAARRRGDHGLPAVQSEDLLRSGAVGLALAWIASFALSGAVGPLPGLADVLLGLTAPAFALLVIVVGVAPRRVMSAQVGAATAVAAVALAQWLGLDPLAWMGWEAPVDGLSVRMRVHATLGNPNFVGALMALTLPLALALDVSEQRRLPSAVSAMSLVFLLSALVATGSRGAVLGLAAGGLVWALLRASRRAVIAVCVVLVVGVMAIWQSPARPLQTTLAGRWYLWQVVAPHAATHPLLGQGPGAVALRFPAWQREADRQGVSDMRFRGLTDHVHNDYLEALVERGLVGVGVLLAVLGAVGVKVWRQAPTKSPLLAGAAASVTAGAACALVDFPLARPVELVWWWMAVVLVHVSTASAPGADG